MNRLIQDVKELKSHNILSNQIKSNQIKSNQIKMKNKNENAKLEQIQSIKKTSDY